MLLMYSIKALAISTQGAHNSRGKVNTMWEVQEIKRIRRRMRRRVGGDEGNLLEAGAAGREVALSPWVFLSGLQGSRQNSLNWFLLLHIQVGATES